MSKKKNQKKILMTVMTPTVRPKGLGLVKKALDRQTFKSFEWLIASPSEMREEICREIGDGFKFISDPPRDEGDYWTFNKVNNLLVKNSRGELIVSVQDYTYFNPDGLEKFWFYFNNGHSRSLISGVGDKYSSRTFTTKVWSDPRKRMDQGTFYECFPNDVEFNYCSVPKQAFFECGGFDEFLDRYAGMDHISVQERLDALGYRFYLDQTNETYSLVHGRLPEWDSNHAMHGGYAARKSELIQNGLWPVLDFLKQDDYNAGNKVKERTS